MLRVVVSLRKSLALAFTLAISVVLVSCGNSSGSSGTATDTPEGTVEVSQTAEGSTVSEGQFDAPPAMQIDTDKIYVATLKTEKGDVVIELFADRAPVTVNNFVFLAEQDFYDGTTFHRVIPGFVAQGGDPTGTGAGGPGYRFQDEIVPGLRFDQDGLLAMANSGPDTNGSQFFITYAPAPWLNGLHTIFGKVISGMNVLYQLTERDPEQSPDFSGDILLDVEIDTRTASSLPTPTLLPDPMPPIPGEGRPLAEIPAAEREGLYNFRPDRVIDVEAEYSARVETTKGTIEISLDPTAAPESVNNFVVLADLGYWDAFPISNVQPSAFVITGSPANRPDSDIGYVLPPETGLEPTEGAVGFWFRQDLLETSGSQIFILLDDLPGMESLFTVIGYVTDGQSVAGQLTLDDSIESITISGPR
jgi:cyclophilin family peptidyl-prolyl cis-trans isomerase